MKKLVTHPVVYGFIEVVNGEIINVSDYIVSGQINRVLNAVSKASLVLRNPEKKWTPKEGPRFHPMDRCTFFLERIPNSPVQVFTGFLDKVPVYQMYPGNVTLTASCTLKRLQFTQWDPALPFVFQFLAQFGWVSDGNGNLLNYSSLEQAPTPDSYNTEVSKAVAEANNAASITLNLNIGQPGGIVAASAKIQYSPHSNLTEAQTASATVQFTTVTAKITNLKVNSVYYFRVVSVDGAGSTTYGPISSFTTSSVTTGPGSAPKFQFTDSSISNVLSKVLEDIGGWDSKSYLIESLPASLPEKLITLYQNLANNETVIASQLQSFLGSLIGSGQYGEAGGNASAGSSTGETGKLTGGSNPQKIFNYFVKQGLSKPQAAGFVGNFQQESGCDPTRENGYLAQWVPGSSRFNNLVSFAASKKKSVTDLGVQLEFVWHELNTDFSSVLGKIKQTKTVKEATIAICGEENARGESEGGYEDPSLPEMKKRIEYAESALREFGNNTTQPNPFENTPREQPSTTESAKNKGGNTSSKSQYESPLKNMPTQFNVTDTTQFGGVDQGVILYTGKIHEPVFAIAPGTIYIKNNGGPGRNKAGENLYGPNYPVIEVSDGPWKGRTIFYGYVAGDSSIPPHGRPVKAGEKIGTVAHQSPGQNKSQGTVDIGFLMSDHNSNPSPWAAGQPATADAETMLINMRQIIAGGAITPSSNDKETGLANSPGTTSLADSQSISTSAAFNTIFAFPSIERTEAAMLLQGEKSYMNDQSLLPFIQQLCQGCLRSFQSMPNGKFFAFFPDYFGGWNHSKAYWEIDDIEILDGKIELTDEALATHVFVAGDTIVANAGTVSLFDQVVSDGVVTIENAGISDFINHNPPGKGGASSSTIGGGDTSFLNSPSSIIAFLQRYGVRPIVEQMPQIHNHQYELFLAYQIFQLMWARQFETTFTFTFMPELYPGGIVAFPGHKIQMFIDQVTHNFDYTHGFTTTANLMAPAVYNPNHEPNVTGAFLSGLVVGENLQTANPGGLA